MNATHVFNLKKLHQEELLMTENTKAYSAPALEKCRHFSFQFYQEVFSKTIKNIKDHTALQTLFATLSDKILQLTPFPERQLIKMAYRTKKIRNVKRRPKTRN